MFDGLIYTMLIFPNVTFGISIPVHEQMDVVIDQINNINYFVPNTIIILHASAQFNEFNKVRINDLFDNVYINPKRMSTSYGTGILTHIHTSNYLALKNMSDIDYFILMSSNELFLKPNCDEYIRKYDAGVFQTPVLLDTILYQGKKALNDVTLKKMINRLDIDHIYWSQHEGTFYRDDIFEQMSNVIMEIIGVKEQNFYQNLVYNSNFSNKYIRYIYKHVVNKLQGSKLYATEEIYYPTLVSKFTDNIGSPYCYMPWKKDLTIDYSDVSYISSKDLSDYGYSDIYSAKRINRNYEDPIRNYIRSINNNYLKK